MEFSLCVKRREEAVDRLPRRFATLEKRFYFNR
jgi:hypothetical protein